MSDPFKRLFKTPAGRAYAEAAKAVEEDRAFFACVALNHALQDEASHRELCDGMRTWFSDGLHSHTATWMMGIAEEEPGGFMSDAERQGRVLALCFMSALAEAGDL